MTDDQIIGLTNHEVELLNEALADLPVLLEEATRAEGTRLSDGGHAGRPVPGSRPPCDLTLIDVHQLIDKAALDVDTEMHHNLHDHGDCPEDVADRLAWLVTHRDWWEPHWCARNSVLIPLRQARTALRRALHIRPQPIYHCRQCGDVLTARDHNGRTTTWTQPWAWAACLGCGATIGQAEALRRLDAERWVAIRDVAEPGTRKWETLRKRVQRAGLRPVAVRPDGTHVYRAADLDQLAAAAA